MKKNELLFLIFGITFAIPVSGGITVADFIVPIFILIVFLGNLLSGKRILNFKKRELILCSLFFSYVIVYLLSDVFAEISINGILRDQLKLLSVFVLALSFSNSKERIASALLFFIVGYATVNLVIVLKGDLAGHNFWRHGVGESITLAIACVLPYKKKSFSVMSLFLLCLLNIITDFRGMAGVMLLSCLVLTFSGFLKFSFEKKVLVLLFVALLTFSSVFYYVSSYSEHATRRGQSDLVRASMVALAISDMLKPNFFGNGSEKFMNDFRVPDLDNAFLAGTIDGKLPLHGYLFVASYEAGKLGLFFFAVIICLIFKQVLLAVLYGLSLSRFSVLIVLIYFSYSSFMQAFSGFDRFVFGLSLGALMSGVSLCRQPNFKYDDKTKYLD